MGKNKKILLQKLLTNNLICAIIKAQRKEKEIKKWSG